jgi:hypothetical protein
LPANSWKWQRDFNSQELNIRKQRRKTMTYSKPEVANLAVAVKAIQGTRGKGQQPYPDANPMDSRTALTIGAYEADE